ncbi:patatin-like phospholipase family protein [Sinimarinibacterium sp. NLF-5-8]|uniref:patatin-like phospholipase family protein n=1 Tax=Sinimarinibacterium sp. NLF-5-8 TaxID=2698684 RepID=UPI001EE40014|nr:patatin-like phospholipase family protein [Sinimarinibacterium sp. NLF-5-8]
MERNKRELLREMKNATDYASWRGAAERLDQLEGWDQWCEDDTSHDYDWRLIRARLRQVRQYRSEGQIAKLVHHLRQGLHWNLGNSGNPRLYQFARVGTKRLIHEYVGEIARTLQFLSELDSPEWPHAAKLKFFDEVSQSYGRSALMLSGGATLGLFHVGVVKALFREGLVPSVVSGSSAGSVVCATVATREPHEVEELLEPESAYYHFWRMLPLRDMLRNRSVMDQNQLRKAIEANVRDWTFEEAYARSGRVINITVSPAGFNQPPRLLNHLTFPYLYLQEAVLASCAVPVIFPPVMLMTQNEQNQRVPYMPLLRWNDGSLKSDLPILRMRRLHNVNHFIVSQTNPHVLPFVSRRGPGDGGALDAARGYLFSTVRDQAKSLIDLARYNLPFGGVRRTLDLGSSILNQEYRGNINILPDVTLWRYANVTSNPDMGAIKRFMLEGERATWPRIEMIRNQMLIGQTLTECLERVERGSAARLAPMGKVRPDLHLIRVRESG